LKNARNRKQLAFAAALTVTLVVALSAVGAVSYAATAVSHAAKAAVHVVAPAKKSGVVVVKGLSAGGDQYRPGYGWGDPNHTHSGPPGLTRGKGGEKAPPAQVKKTTKNDIVTTSVTVDEQAALYFSVLNADGTRLQLTQNGTKIGGGAVSGKRVKTIHYVVLVPRTLPISLVVPKSVLVKGHTYKLHVIAVSPDGSKSTIDIPFVA
jgi:hypothetical protein